MNMRNTESLLEVNKITKTVDVLFVSDYGISMCIDRAGGGFVLRRAGFCQTWLAGSGYNT